MHVARVYLRVSTQGQDLDRQESIIAEARDAASPASTARRHPALAPTGRSCFV
jgi:DNA invertase Pin-like site-specific DNA recombinase